MNEMIKKITVALAFGAALSGVQAFAADGVEIKHLGVNNTLVRVSGDAKYLILPVEESSNDAKINVLVDGKIAETIYVRLAKSKTDYTVPFDLAPYKGHEVIFDVVTPQNRASIREAKNDVCWSGMQLSDTFDTTNTEKYRPAYHHTPLYGWMNDPNGMFYKDGKWHLYFQYNPYGSKWQNMTWGHSVSSDLINWEYLPEAIRPNGLGAVFSGSCAVDSKNTAGFGKDAVIALYTSAGTSQMQSLASSTDGGTTFNIYPGNPIITLESEARDPKVFWNDDIKAWNMILAHALEREMLIFTSPDMKEWTLQSKFGKGLGAQNDVWECPDLFELTVEGNNDKKWVLLCNLNDGPFGGSATQYFIGDFDGKTFTPDTDKDGKVPTKWLDYGKDHYATVTWSDAPDNRRTAIGWMSNWYYAADIPTKQFRSANTVARDLGLFKGADGEIYVSSAPVPELESLRDVVYSKAGKATIGRKNRSFALPTANDGICEIVFDLDAAKATTVEMVLSNDAGDKVVMKYDAEARTLSFDRTQSGVVDFSKHFPSVTVSPTYEADGKVAIRIFVDRSSIEVFGNGGKFVMTNQVFPTKPYSTLAFSATGGNAKIEGLKVYSLKTAE